MSPASLDLWQLLFFAGAGLLIFIQACRGWRAGLLRQLVEVFAVASAYASSYLFGPRVAPLLQPMGLPAPILKALAGSATGFLIYVMVRAVGSIVFKRTAQQGNGIIRFGFGAAGAMVGAVFGVFMVWVLIFAIRLCGSLAESRVKASDAAKPSGQAVYRPTEPADPGWLRGLAHLKEALERGSPGQVVKQIDPLPAVLYGTMGRIGTMLSSEQSVQRFLSYPGIQPLAENSKIIALRNDPEIIRDAMSSNYLGLLHNQRLVQAANDAEILGLLRNFDVQKALDYALSNPEKASRVPAPR